MKGKTKMAVGAALMLAVLAVTFLATPALAVANGADDGNQVQSQKRLRTRDGDCDRDMLMTQTRLRQRLQDCEGECTRIQQREHRRTEAMICKEANLEQNKYQCRKGNPDS